MKVIHPLSFPSWSSQYRRDSAIQQDSVLKLQYSVDVVWLYPNISIGWFRWQANFCLLSPGFNRQRQNIGLFHRSVFLPSRFSPAPFADSFSLIFSMYHHHLLAEIFWGRVLLVLLLLKFIVQWPAQLLLWIHTYIYIIYCMYMYLW